MNAQEVGASTPEASSAEAQSRRGEGPEEKERGPHPSGPIIGFAVGPGVERAVYAVPYERKSSDPVYRPLRIFTLDPAVSLLEGSVATVNVPYEPLEPGPVSALFQVDNYDGWQQVSYRKADLDDPMVLIRDGRDPSPSDPMFHQQMVYAVCGTVYAAFRRALGRNIAWGFDRSGGAQAAPGTLILRPHACRDENAYYDKEEGAINFGYYQAPEEVSGLNLPRGFVFTCLSHDIVAHEVTHALLDGLRARFTYPGGPDVLAFHEAFADLVAIFQHFSYEKVLQSAIRKARGNLAEADLLTDIAGQFGHTTGSDRPLRSAIDVGPDGKLLDRPKPYDPHDEPHALGSVLVSAVFEAFLTIFRRKTARYVRLATGGSGVLPPGELPADLQAVLADEASHLASQFLSICIRAIDYCPPVGLEFGEFLRAVITADYDLVPDDPWGYREAWIDAFRKRKIYPRRVHSLSVDALLWRPPALDIPSVTNLSFSRLAFKGDPCSPASAEELRRQALALGSIVSDPDYMGEFGLARPGDPLLGNDTAELPCVESIRSSRRVGPDGQVVFDLVAEVTQRRIVRSPGGSAEFDFYGGATIILGPKGEVRYVISKRTLGDERLERQRDFIFGEAGKRFWETAEGKRVPGKRLFRMLHG
ncbi:MAG: peptidase M4 [Armatimonadetes bacterium]|nr:peptidase M4 [Armatimonadota bacterium]